MIINKKPVLTELEKKQLFKILNKTWIFDSILGSCENEKEFKEVFEIGSKRAEKVLMKLLSVLGR